MPSRRLIAAVTATVMMFTLALTANAEERGPAPADVRVDAVTDRPVDAVPDRPTDRCDIRRYAATHRDCVTDHPTDRCDLRRFVATHRDNCVTDHSDLNIRKLIHRLVHAGEWEKLVRLLHWLGWI